MTQIDFYTNAPDKLGTACRVAAKAYALGNKVVAVCPDADTAQRVDRMLWLTPATGFVPHCDSASPLAPLTPIVIDHRGDEPVHDQVLVNLRDELPPFFSRFTRLIEIVGTEDDDKQRARERYKFYRDRGYEIRIRDLAAETPR